MNRTSEIEASMANIAYELENDIYNPPILKDTSKPFNMSDYIKPVRVTDEDFGEEKTANENYESDLDADNEISELAKEMVDSYLSEEDGIEQVAKDEDKTYVDQIIDKNVDNLKDIVKADNKIQGIKDATQRFKNDNKDIVNNVPEVTGDVAAMAVTKMAPFPNAKRKVSALRKMVEMEIRRREQKKQAEMKKQSSTLLGNYFFK